MKSYEFLPPEEKNWCVPVTLQALLKSRKFIMSQNQISEYFPMNSKGSNLVFNNSLFNKFLSEFKLISRFQNPHETEIYEDYDIFLRDSFYRSDVIVAYNLAGLQKKDHKPEGHVSLVREFDSTSRIVTLADVILDNKKFVLSDIVANMNPQIDENYGFYIIN